MTNRLNNRPTRRDFLKRSSAGLAGVGSLLSTWKSPCQSKTPQTRVLGGTGIQVTVVGLGATRTSDPAVVRASVDAGINFIDTGRGYQGGQNEAMIGKAIQGIRKGLVLQSKIDIPVRNQEEGLKSTDATARYITRMQNSLEQSLKALQTDWIDVMLLRGVDAQAVLLQEEIAAFFSKRKAAGQIRACGFSAHSNQAALVKAAVAVGTWDVAMVAYNHKGAYTHSNTGRFSEWDQGSLETELAAAHEKGLGIVAMKTCSAGLYAPDSRTTPSYAEALKWILRHAYVHAVMPAMTNMDQIRENVRAMA